ncbi:MAG: imidazole glycerol phosphate synthase subunit HisH [Okeania sp. SIO3C4]|nr:imidazole glycerol phosphate synthase subunit HisH [Okeania sp. SIO3C4]
MNLTIVDYNAGNVRSVAFALERLGISAEITADVDKIRKADKVIFPGVGEASSTMAALRERELAELLPTLKQPFLGICLGMQLMCSFSEEGDTNCLNIIENKVRRFPPKDKVPHMGWNSVYDLKSPLFQHIDAGTYFYFVHSYFVEMNKNTIATSNYINEFSAGIHHDNFFAVQFHPEKSGESGNQVLKSFIEL